MVLLRVKRGDESQFLYEATTAIPTDELRKIVTNIYNGRLKIHRICSGMTTSNVMHFTNSFLSASAAVPLGCDVIIIRFDST